LLFIGKDCAPRYRPQTYLKPSAKSSNTANSAVRGVNAEQFVTHHFAMAEAHKAFELAAGYRDGVIKAVIHLLPRS